MKNYYPIFILIAIVCLFAFTLTHSGSEIKRTVIMLPEQPEQPVRSYGENDEDSLWHQ